jgi:class 3 adenylate cyclase/predicted ATPase
MLCASCGTENRVGSRFCDNCGTALAVACPACGDANRSDARFCASCGTVLAAGAIAVPPATKPKAEAERRLVSVLFADLVGFTTYAEDRDPEHVRELLSRYFETATEIIGRHGGTIEKFIGDAVMAVWGTPVAHEDDAERAVRAALEVIDGVRGLGSNLDARAGVLTGEAAVTIGARNQGMVAGDLVNTAARLQGVAEPGTVLVGEATMRAASGAIVFEPIGDHSLKGKTAPVPAWRALRVVAARGGQGRADSLESPFVGRAEELRLLKEQLHAVGRERRLRLVSITGPAGIGKSRLVWELEKYVDGVTEDMYWHRGRSPSYGEGVTFWALGEMIRRRAGLVEDDDEKTTRERVVATVEQFVPDPADRELIQPALLSLLGVEPAPAAGRDALFPAWRLFFERVAERGTVVLVFEDLQWADSGLLDFIDHLLDWSRALPIAVVTLARPELFDRRADWGSSRRHLTALALEPLSDEEVTELLAGLVPGLPDVAVRAIVARAEGMPLYAVETVRALLADGRIERVDDAYRPVGDLSHLTVPETLRSLIASRLDGLEPADRSLLQDAAVVGQVFATETLAAITGISRADLDPRLRGLVRRELLDVETDPRSPERGQYKFVQSLIREVAYGTLGRRDRRARHLAVARHLESVGDEEMAGALASHYVAAHETSDDGPEADAVAAQARLALSAAAERAASLGSPDQAIAYLEQALAITGDPRDRAPLLDRAARSAVAAARQDAQRYAEAAVESYRKNGDGIAAARATARLGRVLLETGEVARAMQLLEASVPAAEAIDDPSVLAETLANLARPYMRAGMAARSVEVADRALAIAERLNLDAVVAEAFVNKAAALIQLGRRRESVALHEAALELAKRLNDRGFEMRVRNNLAASLSDDEPARAMRMLLEGMEIARQVGDRSMYHWLAGTAGPGLIAEGRGWDAHIIVLEEALESATLRYDRQRLRVLLGLFQISRGEKLKELVDDVAELVGDSTDPEDLFTLYMMQGETDLLSGNPEAAYAAALKTVELTNQNPEIPLFLATRAAIWSRDLERARHADNLLADLPATGSLTQAMRVHSSAAVAALEGRPAEAVAGFRDVDARMRQMEQFFDAARYAIDAAVLLPGEPEIRALVENARPLLVELRAKPYLDRLDAGLAGHSPASPAPAATSLASVGD